MPRPEEWKGSDLRSRAEIVQYLHNHGGQVHDPSGHVVGPMRRELGKGRAISQLLSDMARDGMIERDVNAKCTYTIKLVDDWGLLGDISTPKPSQTRSVTHPASADEDVVDITGEVDLEALANQLLAIVIKRAHTQPSQGAELEKLRQKLAKITGERDELRSLLVEARADAEEQRRQADTMRESLLKLQRSMDKPKRGQVPVTELLRPEDKRLLDTLVKSVQGGQG